ARPDRRAHDVLVTGAPALRSRPLRRRDVLVEAKDVVRVVAALERPQALVLRPPVGLADALRALVHEEVHVHAPMMRSERRPEVAHPLPLAVEALGPGGAGADVERERGLAPVEGALAVVH